MLPLVVDLDGTLIKTDLLVETAFQFVLSQPWNSYKLLHWLVQGRAVLKSELAKKTHIDATTLPYNEELVNWLKQEKEKGRCIVLATASHILLATKVADYLGLFDDVLATEGTINLNANDKRAALVDRFGERGYDYVGNSKADLTVWQSSTVIHLANPECGVLRKAHKIGTIGMIFDERTGYFRTLVKAMRIHQWAKNMLIFVPLLASHRLFELPLVLDGLVAFMAFCACASSVYLLNDLIEQQQDNNIVYISRKIE